MRRHSSGFTLIEMMLVLALIALATGMVVLTLPTDSRAQTAGRQLEQFADAIALLRDRAVMEGRVIGLLIDGHQYRFMSLMSTTSSSSPGEISWQPYLLPRLPTAGEFDPLLRLSWSLSTLTLTEDSTTDAAVDAGTPQIFLLPGGEITPFELTLSDQAAFYRRLIVTEMGQIAISQTAENGPGNGMMR